MTRSTPALTASPREDRATARWSAASWSSTVTRPRIPEPDILGDILSRPNGSAAISLCLQQHSRPLETFLTFFPVLFPAYPSIVHMTACRLPAGHRASGGKGSNQILMSKRSIVPLALL